MKKEIDNNSMWAAFRQELVLQGELQVVAAIDNALNNLGFTIEETSTIIPIPLKQGDKDEEILILKDKIESLHAAINAIKETHRIELEKQCEQKPTIEMKSAGESLGIDSETYNKIVDECIYGEQKPAWSKKDEEHVNSLLKRLEGLCRNEFTTTRFAINEDETWLKSLKDRVQPKQEWSEEDESNLEFVISQLRIVIDEKHFAPVIDWLKSLRHRLQWKPSAEQIKALETTLYTNMSRNDERYSVLSEFVAELKKLKG